MDQDDSLQNEINSTTKKNFAENKKVNSMTENISNNTNSTVSDALVKLNREYNQEIMTIPDQEVERIINWEDFFSRIQQATGITDLNVLTKTII